MQERNKENARNKEMQEINICKKCKKERKKYLQERNKEMQERNKEMQERNICKKCLLTLYGPNSFFRRFSGHNQR